MPKPVVLVAEELAPSALAVHADDFEVRQVDGADRAALLPALGDVDAVIVRSATHIDAEALAVADRLKVVARAGVGLDNVDVPAATARGALFGNAPASNIGFAAEHAVALLLAVARRIPQAAPHLKAADAGRQFPASRPPTGSAAAKPASRSPTRPWASPGSGASASSSPSACPPSGCDCSPTTPTSPPPAPRRSASGSSRSTSSCARAT